MDPQSLIACWELGRRRHPLDRALLLYAAAEPDADPETLADRPLGERNAALLRLRRTLFGDEVSACVDCPACGERLGFALNAGALLARAVETAQVDATRGGPRELRFGGRVLRIPTTRDLASVAAEADEPAATRKLLERLCVDGNATEWSAEFQVQLTQALDEADPCMDLALELSCPACRHEWSASFDVPGFVWDEIDARARRLLDEVHALARSYCWSEREILTLSDTRRRAYLERVLA
jgi:hypothetical protein